MNRIIVQLTFVLGISSLSAIGQGTWTWMHGSESKDQTGVYGTKDVSDPANIPPGIYEGAEWTDQNGKFWLYGGKNKGDRDEYADLWMFDPLTNEWTWVTGTNGVINISPDYGTKGTGSVNNFPGSRAWGVATWIDTTGNLWLFGGQGYDISGTHGGLNDLWKYDINTKEWTWMHGSQNAWDEGVYGSKNTPNPNDYPKSRWEVVGTWVDEDGDLWLYGGRTRSGGVSLQMDDVWKYNIASNTWIWVKGDGNQYVNPNYGTKGVSSPSNTPGSRDVHGVWKDFSGNFWMFGGSRESSDLGLDEMRNDLWKFDPNTLEWTWISGSNLADDPGNKGPACVASTENYPSARKEHRTTWIDGCENLWMFGGQTTNSGGAAVGDLWFYNISNNTWTWVSGSTNINEAPNHGVLKTPSPVNAPGARGGAVGWYEETTGSLWMFGGAIGFPSVANDMWKFEPEDGCPALPGPPPEAAFSNDTLHGCAGGKVNFYNESLNADTYIWMFGDDSTSMEEDPAHIYSTGGNYEITLIACNNACNSVCDTIKQSVNVTPGNFIVIPNVATKNGCDRSGGNSGSAKVDVTGGTPPYTYLWNTIPEQTTDSAIGLGSGIYIVTVTDQAGCSTIDSIYVEELIQVHDTIVPSTCSTCPDGSITLTVGGDGKPPFTYRWDDENQQTTSVATGLKPGTYSVIVTDADGCFRIIEYEISFVDGINETSPTDYIRVFPNPSNGKLNIAIERNFHDAEFLIFNYSGQTLYRETIKATGKVEGIVLNLPDGIYMYTISVDGKVMKSDRLLFFNQ